MLRDDVVRILRDLRSVLRARVVEITRNPEARTGVVGHLRPLGGDEYLRVELGDSTPFDISVPEQLERTARQLRSAARLAQSVLPEVSANDVATARNPTQSALLLRIAAFLEALANQSHTDNAILTLRGVVVASARPISDEWHLRIPLVVKQVEANVSRAAQSSHSELIASDVFAMSFWYRAILIIPQHDGYGEDFIRHRCRQVARELALLLPELLPDPPSSAAQRPPL
jgi:hypothetical protein